VARPSNKEKLVSDALRVVHQRGFGGASVRDIVKAAGVPQGFFTNHFVSKEAFGLEILQRYYEMTNASVRATLRNDSLPPATQTARVDRETTRVPALGRHAPRLPQREPECRSQRGERGDPHPA
jgi:AcrR family transcriptional regulator